MTSKLYFRQPNATKEQFITFDGSVIQIGDVRRLVAQKMGLGPDGSLEIRLFEPNTSEEYTDDAKAIPRNSSVLVKRAPANRPQALGMQSTTAPSAPPVVSVPAADQEPAADARAAEGAEFGGDFYTEAPAAPVVDDEESKALAERLRGTASGWQREVQQASFRGRGRGRGRGGQVHFDYRCPRCDAVGQHDVQSCPTQGDPAYDNRRRFRPAVGIPMTRLTHADAGGILMPNGQAGTLFANESGFASLIPGAFPTKPVEQPQEPIPAAVEETKHVSPVLALDSKPAAAAAAVDTSLPAMPVMPVAPPPPGAPPPTTAPLLAGDEDLNKGPSGGDAGFFFEMFARGDLPRGPPDFITRAYNSEEPMSKKEFERMQDDFRHRYNMPPLKRSARPRSRSPASRSRRHRSRSRSAERHRDRGRDRSLDRSKERSRRRSVERDGRRDRDKEKEKERSKRKEEERKKRSSKDEANNKKSKEPSPSAAPEDGTKTNGKDKEERKDKVREGSKSRHATPAAADPDKDRLKHGSSRDRKGRDKETEKDRKERKEKKDRKDRDKGKDIDSKSIDNHKEKERPSKRERSVDRGAHKESSKREKKTQA